MAVLRAEADAIAAQAALGHARLGRLGAESLSAADGTIENVLLHGEMGPLSCGLVGTGFAVVQAIQAVQATHAVPPSDRPVHVWVTDGGRSLDGARLSAMQLAQLDTPHTVVADAAVGWLFDNRRLDAVLLRGDWVCANGDTGAPIGSLGVARLAAAAGVPVSVCATGSAFDLASVDGAAVPMEMRPPDPSVGNRPASTSRLDPAVDVVPCGLIANFMTANGVLRPPFGELG
jgi:methylthioribose-1-phosphate isomerase